MNEETWQAEHEKYLASLPDSVKARIEYARSKDSTGGDNIVLLHDMEEAMVGITLSDTGRIVSVYEEHLCIDVMAEHYKQSDPTRSDDDCYQDALDWYNFNTLGSLPNMKEIMPLMFDGFVDDREAELADINIGLIPGLRKDAIVGTAEGRPLSPEDEGRIPVYEWNKCLYYIKQDLIGENGGVVPENLDAMSEERFSNILKSYENTEGHREIYVIDAFPDFREILFDDSIPAVPLSQECHLSE